MTTYWKAVRPDGTDFHTGTVQWAPPAGHVGEWLVRHPTASVIGDGASGYLSVASVPTDCTGMGWPCRLLEVEAVGEVTTPNRAFPHKRAGVAFRVLREVPATEALGPQGEHAAALIRSIPAITGTTANRVALARRAVLDAAWNASRKASRNATLDASREAALGAARDAAWDASREAALGASRDAAWRAASRVASHATLDATRDATREAVWALLVRDLITTEQYDALTRPWRTAVGPIHPDDPAL